MMKMLIIIVLLLKLSQCFAQKDKTSFMMYNAYKDRCMGDSLIRLSVCSPQNPRHKFRWTSENRIFNVGQKKCLGTESKSEGSKLQWYICDANSDLQKWECQSNSLFGLKNESLYLSVQEDSYLLTLSRDPGNRGKWTVRGTVDSICSRPYEEMYSLKGNALGRPCHFPFLYNNKWYADCTTDNRSSSLEWCSIEQEYEPNQLWGYCPCPKVNEFWRKNPLTGVYYQVNEDSALTWYQARKSCQQQGGDLLSITELHEQTFISGLTQMTGPVLWTGLNSLDASSGWRWVNGQPLRYLKWLSGQPSSLPGHSCGVLSPLYGSEWSTAVCSQKLGYICQRGLPTPTVPPVVLTGSCYSPWIPYSGHCYLLSRTKKTWLEARDACRREGGDLLSVLSVEEQSFTISQLGYTKTDELWIGLNDLGTSMLFEWSDRSRVLFALWDVNEPSHNAALMEDCVLMRGEEGKWADQICQNQYGYICKKKKHLNPSINDTVVSSPGCKPGWVRNGYYCYLAGTEAKTFEEAKQMCEKTGSYLTDITNRVENAFLVSLIGARPETHFWIGLSNQKDQHTFEWTNANKVSFTHFNAGMPGGQQGCVAMTTGVHAGLWDVLSCTNRERYICKQKAEGVITTPAPPVTPTPSCSSDWYPITKRNFCFKMFSVANNKKKTWSEALDFCRELGGDLLSIHSASDLEAFNYHLTTGWIGYSIQDPSAGYTWSDGSSSSYENWSHGEPDNLNNVEKCVKIKERLAWMQSTRWSDWCCDERMNWFCEIQKGVIPKKVDITSKTYNTTGDGWIIFKDNQYYINTRPYSMEEGRRFCKDRHSDLVVINDEEERLFLWHQIKERQNEFYIAMHVDLDKSVSWMDGSPVIFQAWQKNQPAFLNNDEHCVKMSWYQGLWQTQNCGDEELLVCERSGSVPATHVTAVPTESPTGGCAPDWMQFQGKCYMIGLDLRTWADARSYCKRLGGNLASITNRLQQAFITSRMDDPRTPDLWHGLNSLVGDRLKWTDGSRVHFIDWAHEDFHLGDQICGVMGGAGRAELGKWVKKNCNDTSGYICSRAVDRSLVPSTTEVPKTFIKLGNCSYMLVQTNMTWKEAQSHCEAEGANLASIRDAFTQSYIELQTHKLGQPLWIGLNSVETDGYFMWIDKWQLNMEKWASYEPNKHPCVYVDVDGTWRTALCNQTYYSLCKKSTEIAPTLPAQYLGVCPEETEDEPKMTWLPYKGYCYAIVKRKESWNTASRICMTRGANLVSILDTMESKFIEKCLRLFGSRYERYWLGLFRTYSGHWQWLDKSVMDYTNWMLSSSKYDTYEERTCPFITATDYEWGIQYCNSDMPFICKTEKVLSTVPPTETTHTGEAETRYVPYGAVSVVVALAAVFSLAGLVYIFHRCSKSQAASSTFENPMYYRVAGPLQEEN
ncbi:macrophage mannose receptor 1-like [Salminus brasiliensis]|uniref:macrophage mannose receptor 1-like n=1 Tax=Salminus brasiliensis TaxID=930266 RepID=UPI003B82CFFF